MKNTDYLGLKLPESEDPYNIEDFNINLRTVDSELKKLNDEKQNVITGAATSVIQNNIAAGKALVSDGKGKISASSVSGTELSYLKGLKNGVQSQLDGKQPSLGFVPVQQGGGMNQLDNKVYIGWSGSSLKVQIDATDMGNIITDGAANGTVLPLAKGGTGKSDADSALNALTRETDVSFADFCYVINGKADRAIGKVKKIGNRIIAAVTAYNAVSPAGAKGQILTIKSPFYTDSVFGSSSVGSVYGYAVGDDGLNSPVTGYINAGGARNGIVTCIFPSAGKVYPTLNLFFDYYCGA